MWIFLSFLSAFSLASSDALIKYILNNSNEYLIGWLRLVFSLPLLIAILLFIDIPNIDKWFWIAFFTAIPLEIIAIIFYIKAIKSSDLSLVLPFLSLTPVFLIFFSWLILGEKVSLTGAIGILLVAIGGYSLNASSIRKGLTEPIKAIFKEKGIKYMILVSCIYSITSSLGKMAINHSSPLFFAPLYFTAVTILFTPLVYMKVKKEFLFLIINKYKKNIILSGIFYGIMIISHIIAISISEVAYMIAIKRSSMLIGSIYGFILFGEKKIKERLIGVILMLAGIFFIIKSTI